MHDVPTVDAEYFQNDSISSPHSVFHLLYNILIVGYAISELCCLKLEKKRGKTVHSILNLKQKIVPRVKPTWVKKISPLLYLPHPTGLFITRQEMTLLRSLPTPTKR